MGGEQTWGLLVGVHCVESGWEVLHKTLEPVGRSLMGLLHGGGYSSVPG